MCIAQILRVYMSMSYYVYVFSCLYVYRNTMNLSDELHGQISEKPMGANRSRKKHGLNSIGDRTNKNTIYSDK